MKSSSVRSSRHHAVASGLRAANFVRQVRGDRAQAGSEHAAMRFGEEHSYPLAEACQVIALRARNQNDGI